MLDFYGRATVFVLGLLIAVEAAHNFGAYTIPATANGCNYCPSEMQGATKFNDVCFLLPTPPVTDRTHCFCDVGGSVLNQCEQALKRWPCGFYRTDGNPPKNTTTAAQYIPWTTGIMIDFQDTLSNAWVYTAAQRPMINTCGHCLMGYMEADFIGGNLIVNPVTAGWNPAVTDPIAQSNMVRRRVGGVFGCMEDPCFTEAGGDRCQTVNRQPCTAASPVTCGRCLCGWSGDSCTTPKSDVCTVGGSLVNLRPSTLNINGAGLDTTSYIALVWQANAACVGLPNPDVLVCDGVNCLESPKRLENCGMNGCQITVNNPVLAWGSPTICLWVEANNAWQPPYDATSLTVVLEAGSFAPTTAPSNPPTPPTTAAPSRAPSTSAPTLPPNYPTPPPTPSPPTPPTNCDIYTQPPVQEGDSHSGSAAGTEVEVDSEGNIYLSVNHTDRVRININEFTEFGASLTTTASTGKAGKGPSPLPDPKGGVDTDANTHDHQHIRTFTFEDFAASLPAGKADPKGGKGSTSTDYTDKDFEWVVRGPSVCPVPSTGIPAVTFVLQTTKSDAPSTTVEVRVMLVTQAGDVPNGSGNWQVTPGQILIQVHMYDWRWCLPVLSAQFPPSANWCPVLPVDVEACPWIPGATCPVRHYVGEGLEFSLTLQDVGDDDDDDDDHHHSHDDDDDDDHCDSPIPDPKGKGKGKAGPAEIGGWTGCEGGGDDCFVIGVGLEAHFPPNALSDGQWVPIPDIFPSAEGSSCNGGSITAGWNSHLPANVPVPTGDSCGTLPSRPTTTDNSYWIQIVTKPVDGGYGDWDPCPVVCGAGTQTRHCHHPKPKFGGRPCDGPKAKPCTCPKCPKAPLPGSLLISFTFDSIADVNTWTAENSADFVNDLGSSLGLDTGVFGPVTVVQSTPSSGKGAAPATGVTVTTYIPCGGSATFKCPTVAETTSSSYATKTAALEALQTSLTFTGSLIGATYSAPSVTVSPVKEKNGFNTSAKIAVLVIVCVAVVGVMVGTALLWRRRLAMKKQEEADAVAFTREDDLNGGRRENVAIQI